ncbi:MAG: putative dsRNA-binding protein [Trueperaceae bacterium]|nr:putative dsRNA-binding protein [Trueperaceae bacterium]
MAHPKGVLIERLQNEGRQPRFVTNVDGPDHEPTFHAEVVVDDDVLGRGDGGTKRTAERRAAEEALAALDAADAPDDDAPAAPAKKGRRRGSRGGKRNGPAPDATPDTTAAAPAAVAAEAAVAPDDAPFDGPWPVFESVLASSVRVAHERVAVGLHGDEAREAVGRFALQLYKELLLDLGEIAWDDEDAD